MNKQFYGVIMAGGVGSRFWPMSKSDHPKQFMDILGTGQSLLQQTFERLTAICPPENIYIVTNERYRDITQEQLPSINADQVLCEPMRRNTAPCIAYANFKILSRDPEASIVVTPSDHLILKNDVFTETISKALHHASNSDSLLTIGIEPSRPDTGYGYIKYLDSGNDFSKVDSFTEKPDLETAKQFLESGNYSWNSGMFIWNVQNINRSFSKFLPDMMQLFEKGMGKYGTDAETDFINEIYPICEDISIDYGIMEKADNVEVINGDFGWSDLGTWGSLYDHIPLDEGKNAIVGDQVLSFDSNGNIIHVPQGKLLVTQGIEDTIIIEHDNILLICKKDEEQKIKQIVSHLEKSADGKYT